MQSTAAEGSEGTPLSEGRRRVLGLLLDTRLELRYLGGNRRVWRRSALLARVAGRFAVALSVFVQPGFGSLCAALFLTLEYK
jgi:hypothetical protein